MNVSLLHIINGWAGRSSLLDAGGRFAAEDLLYVAAIATVLGLIFAARKDRRRALLLAVVALGSAVVTLALAAAASVLWYEARPFVADPSVRLLIQHSPDSGFPSDHVAVAASLATSLLFGRELRAGLFVSLCTLLIAIARVFVGVHYPSDVAAAVVLGVLITFGIDALVRRVLRPRQTERVR